MGKYGWIQRFLGGNGEDWGLTEMMMEWEVSRTRFGHRCHLLKQETGRGTGLQELNSPWTC